MDNEHIIDENVITVDVSAGDENLASFDIVVRYMDGVFDPRFCQYVETGNIVPYGFAAVLMAHVITQAETPPADLN